MAAGWRLPVDAARGVSLLDRDTARSGSADNRDAGVRYELYMGRWSRLVATTFVEWLDVPQGGVWLDVGCGTGAVSAAIGDIAQPLAVTGVDLSAELVAHASELSMSPAADFCVADASALPFADGIFDMVVSGLVLDVLTDPVEALREQARVVDASGIVAAYVWDYAHGLGPLRHFWDAARRVTPSAVALDEVVRFPATAPAGLERLFEAAGLDPLGVTSFDVEIACADFDDFWMPLERGQWSAPRFLAGLDDAERGALRVGLRAALPVADDGSISLSARAWAIRARP
jgi:SAM-dependent methyltransferase